MAQRADRRQRFPSLDRLRLAAYSALRQAANGAEPELSRAELADVEQAAEELIKLKVQLNPTQLLLPIHDARHVWGKQGDTAAYLALFFLALRRSSPFAMGDGPGPALAAVREGLSGQLSGMYLTKMAAHAPVCALLGPALQLTGALQCYSRLFAEAAAQLQPAAALALPAQLVSNGAAGSHATDPLQPGAAGSGHSSEQGPPGQANHPAAPEAKPQTRPSSGQPSLQQLERLLRELFHVLGVFRMLVNKDTVRSQLQSSYVLEHWARLLLLGTAAALAGGDSTQQRKAQALQAELLHGLSNFHMALELDYCTFLLRPWGCTLAATHMAQLCAALDGGHAFGLVQAPLLVLPASTAVEKESMARISPAAFQYDERLIGRSASLRTARVTIAGWFMRLAGLHTIPGLTSANEEQHAEGHGAVPPDPLHPDASHGRLPPFNRPATIALCLRLAKGLLASWGGTLPRVRLQLPDGTVSRNAPPMPKVTSCGLLQRALTCARLALMRDVWRKERVRRRMGAQLREWWEMYVAAAQHPEALLVGEVAQAETLNEIYETLGIPAGPSADATAAIEAGLLPCVTRLVTRMGAGGSGSDVVWCPPDRYPTGVGACWEQLLQFGPLEQVGELMAALGRRLRLAVEMLQRTAAAAGRKGGAAALGGGRVGWLAEVAREVMDFARQRMVDLSLTVLKSGALLSACQGQSSTGEGSTAASSAGSHAGPAAVRMSYAAAELLPALSQGVQLCAELRRGDGWGALCATGGKDGAGALQRLAASATLCAATALECTVPLLVRHLLETAEQAGGVDSVPHGGGAAGGGSGAGAPWRQLLLRDVQLMELLGAGGRLYEACNHDHAAGGRSVSEFGQGVYVQGRLRDGLARVLPLAAAAFPAELRAAVDAPAAAGAPAAAAGGSNASATRPGPQIADKAHAAGPSTVRYCIPRRVVEEVLGCCYYPEWGAWMQQVLRGGQLSGEVVGKLTEFHVRFYVAGREGVTRLLRALPPPEEARAAVAAAVAAGPARCGA